MSGAHSLDHATLPAVPAGAFGRILAAGAVGLIAWEAFARLVAPFWLGDALDPTGLIEAAVGVSGGPAQLLHLLTGLVFFPVGYAFLVLPLARHLLPGLPWPLLGLGYGVALWIFALFGMASLLGGMPPFLGFEPVAWLSLAGHLGLGLGIAAATAMLDEGSK